MTGQQNRQKLYNLAWPASRLGEAIETIARKSGFSTLPIELPAPPKQLEGDELNRWIDAAAGRLELEAEAIEAPYPEVEYMVCNAGPALIYLPGSLDKDEFRFLLLLKKSWLGVTIIGADLSTHRVKPEEIRAALCHKIEIPWLKVVDQLISDINIPEERREQTRKAIMSEQLNSTEIQGGWILRLSPGNSMWKQARHAKLFYPTIIFLVAHITQQFLNVLSWWIIGKGVMEGHFDWGWLLAWALILFTAIPMQLIASKAQSLLAIWSGWIFKQRLLHGTLKLDPEEVKHQGAGQFLGRVMESEAIEMLALGSGFISVVSFIELIIAAWVLSMGTGGWLHSLLLLIWILFTFLVGWLYLLRGYPWVKQYQGMTNDLVEKMVGHRTRLAQEDNTEWHNDEDRTLSHYLKLSERLDRFETQLGSFLSRGWLILGLAGLSYTFVTTPDSFALLAVSLGGVLLAFQALNRLMAGIISMVDIILVWDQIAPLFNAAARPEDTQSLEFGFLVDDDNQEAKEKTTKQNNNTKLVLTARDLVFRYRQYGSPVLKGCSLEIRKGDRLLLEGPSGGGKSTLAALLTGLRQPESGLLLLHGFDKQTIGVAEWRRRIVSAPQFHENHILTETFAFNLLMGRRWPPTTEDMAEAELICRELGLGELIERMPAGFQQMIGESGWRLSHGEQSRLYIARALLQNASIVVLDESFAALDPENLRRALNCVLNRANTLLVIAHP